MIDPPVWVDGLIQMISGTHEGDSKAVLFSSALYLVQILPRAVHIHRQVAAMCLLVLDKEIQELCISLQTQKPFNVLWKASTYKAALALLQNTVMRSNQCADRCRCCNDAHITMVSLQDEDLGKSTLPQTALPMKYAPFVK